MHDSAGMGLVFVFLINLNGYPDLPSSQNSLTLNMNIGLQLRAQLWFFTTFPNITF